MTRRDVLWSLAAPALLGVVRRGRPRLRVAPSLGLLAGAVGGTTEAALDEAARLGVGHVEDALLLLRSDDERRALAAGLAGRRLSMGTFLANSGYADDGLAGGNRSSAETLARDIETAAGVARSMGAVYLTVIPGAAAAGVDGFGAAPAAVREAAAIAEAAGCVLAIEALDRERYPGILVGSPDEAGAFCEAVGHPACVVLFDAFQAPQPPGPAFDRVAARTGYVQVVVTPESPAPAAFMAHLSACGYAGILGVDMVDLAPDACRAVLDWCTDT